MTLAYFFERNLNKTVSFLTRNFPKEYEEPCNLILYPNELMCIAYQNQNDYKNAYKCLLCENSMKHLNDIVFCACCSSRRNFLRNISLTKYRRGDAKIIKIPQAKMDPFLDYIEAKVSKNVEKILNVICLIPDFYEAYLLLAEIGKKRIVLNERFSMVYYLHSIILNDLNNSMEVFDDIIFNKTNKNVIENIIVKNNLNLVAAGYYFIGNVEKSNFVFELIMKDNLDLKCPGSNIDSCEFLWVYALIQYSKGEKLQPLYEYIEDIDSLDYKITSGIYNCSLGEFLKGKNFFESVVKTVRDTQNNIHFAYANCLLAQCFRKLLETENAEKHLKMAYRARPGCFVILYMVAMEYYELKEYTKSYWYCKKCIECKEDGGIFKLLGKIHLDKGDLQIAVEYFLKGFSMKEYDCLLYLAEVYKNSNEMEQALVMYEKYVELGDKNKEMVINYLISHYNDTGNIEKYNYYNRLK